MTNATNLHHPIRYTELDIAASERFSKLPHIKQGDLLVARPSLYLDNRMAEVLRFIAAHPDRVHIVQVRSMGTAYALKKLMDHPLRRVAVLSMDEAESNGCRNHAAYLAHALETPAFRVIVGMQTILCQGWRTELPNLAISCSFDLQAEFAAQLAHRICNEDAARMIFALPEADLPARALHSLSPTPDPAAAAEAVWTPFAVKRPADMTHIIWRNKSSATCVGTGYYCEEDAYDWGLEGDWIAVADLQKLATAK